MKNILILLFLSFFSFKQVKSQIDKNKVDFFKKLVKEYNRKQEVIKKRKIRISKYRSSSYLDTIRYVDSKGNINTPETFGLRGRFKSNFYQGVSEIYHASDTVQISAISIYALLDFNTTKNDQPDYPIGIAIRNIDEVNRIPSTLIDSMSINLSDSGITSQVVNLPRSVTVYKNFAIALYVDTNTTRELYIIRSRADSTGGPIDGRGEEQLGHYRYGVWTNKSITEISPGRKKIFDFDIYLRPIVTQRVLSRFTIPSRGCKNKELRITNTAGIDTAGMMNQKDTIRGNDSYFEYSFGNGIIKKESNPSIIYNSLGTYNITQFIRSKSWSNIIYTDRTTRSITINDTYLVDSNLKICNEDSALIRGTYVKSAGIYYDTLTSQFGCDSIIRINLDVYPSSENNVNYKICSGDSILIGGIYRKMAGTYKDTNTNTNTRGCRVITSYNLKVDITKNIKKDTSICEGDSILIAGFYRKTAGVYIGSYKTINVCDSIIETKLEVNPTTYTKQTYYLCGDKDTLKLRGKEYFTAGVFNDTLKSSKNCNIIFENTIIQSSSELLTSAFAFYIKPGTPDISFTNFSSNNANAFLWQFGDGDTSIEKNPMHDYKNSTKEFKPCLIARIQNNSGKICAADTFCRKVLSVDRFNKFQSVAIYPIPAQESINIDNIPEFCDCAFSVIDILGREVINFSSTKEKNILLNVSNLQSGAYFLKIVDKQESDILFKKIQIIK